MRKLLLELGTSEEFSFLKEWNDFDNSMEDGWIKKRKNNIVVFCYKPNKPALNLKNSEYDNFQPIIRSKIIFKVLSECCNLNFKLIHIFINEKTNDRTRHV